MKNKFRQDKGTAGLTILLSIVVMLFVIGLLIMIFALMGNSLKDSTYTSTTATILNETVTTLNDTVGDLLSKSTLRNVVCTVNIVQNRSSGAVVPATNYTVTNCLITGVPSSFYINQNVNVSYSYTYDADNTATNVMNDTTASLSTTTSWFDIFVVIGAMVVMILLTVIIITAIRSSGMVAGNSSGANTVGTA